MKNTLTILITFVLLSGVVFGQKGIDPQTDRIKETGDKSTRTNDVSRSWSFGTGKTRVRDRLENPFRLNSRRDILVTTIVTLLSENKIIIDDSASRLGDGFIITQPYVFAKGPVTTQSELNRYALLPNSGTSWTRGRYTFTIEVQSIDGMQNNVYVTAKIEGRSSNGLSAEWTTLQSSGLAEDVFLSKLVELITGVSPDASQVIDQP